MYEELISGKGSVAESDGFRCHPRFCELFLEQKKFPGPVKPLDAISLVQSM